MSTHSIDIWPFLILVSRGSYIILFVCVLVLMGAGYIVLAGSLGKAACACNSQESLFILTVKIVTNGFSQM